MNCQKAQSMITPFVDNKLSIRDLELFLDHVNSCPNCREELEVYYALLTAMKQLDEDKNLSSNYSMELAEKLAKLHEKIIHAKYVYYRKKVVLFITMIFLAVLISFTYANRNILIEEQTTKSDFHMRIQFQFPGNDNDMLRLKLQKYLEEQVPADKTD